jgi:hypothetical protein
MATFVALSALNGCGGTNTPSGSVVNSPGGPGKPPTKLVGITVKVAIPAPSKGARPNYISPSTESISIQLVSVDGNGVTGVNPTQINTVKGARACSAQGDSLVCSAKSIGSPGEDGFAVTAYPQKDGNGPVLAAGTVTAKVSAGSTVSVTSSSLGLQGIITSLRLSLSPAKAKRGVKTRVAVMLAAYDASGAEITGRNDYGAPITLQIQGDTQNAFRLSDSEGAGASLTIRKPTNDIALSYDGNKEASPVTLQATVSGPSGINADANFSLTGKQPPPPVGTVYALNFGSTGQGAVVTEYSGNAKGNAAPVRTLNLDSKLYAVNIALDPQGNLEVGYFDTATGESDGKPDTGNEIAIYAPNASGNDQPAAVLESDPSTSTALYPIFMTFDPSGRLVTYGATTVDDNAGNSVLTYAAGSKNQTAPAYAFAFQSIGMTYPGPTGLAVDSANNFYVNGAFRQGFQSADALYVVSAADIGDPTTEPSRTIPWSGAAKLGTQVTVDALDKSGEIFIGNAQRSGSGSKALCQAAANVYSSGTTGESQNDAPIRILTLDGITSTGTDCTNAFDPRYFYFPTLTMYDGAQLFAADAYSNVIAAFSASGHGPVKPVLQIAGSATLLNAPVALAIGSASGPAKAGPVTGARAPATQLHPKHPNAR